MNLWIILKVALRSLRRTLLRSSLTALGIIIGVASVIAMVSIGNGAKAQVEEMLSKLDSNRLTLHAIPPFAEMFNPKGYRAPGRKEGLTIEDYRAMRAELPILGLSTPQFYSNSGGTVQANGRSSSSRVIGIDTDGFNLYSRVLSSGTSFGDSDVERAASVCLISDFMRQTLFPDKDPIGEPLRISGIPFIIIGVMADGEADPYQSMMGGGGGDTQVYVPYTSLLLRLDRNAENGMSIILKPKLPSQLGRLQEQVNDLMERRRGSRTMNFMTGNMTQAIEAFNESSRTMTLLLAAVGGISLLVGGVGIMNIMLVSVTERTREIGIRLAIGTRGRDVLRQFLIEAVILSLLGGMMGILLGIGVAHAITSFNGWPTEVTLSSIVAAFLCAAGIGIFFGFYPARQAARLDPVEALRSE
jgi:putative ABC transport system permease protein